MYEKVDGMAIVRDAEMVVDLDFCDYIGEYDLWDVQTMPDQVGRCHTHKRRLKG